MSYKILMVLTSHSRLGDTSKKTGFWLEELATPYYTFKQAGAEVTLASPHGGRAPIDPSSESEGSSTKETRRFMDDIQAQELLSQTKKLSEIDSADFDAIFYPGGHGPLWDLVSDSNSIRLIEEFWESEKPVASVCHGPIVLLNAKLNNGDFIVDGRKVTGFSNSEEDAFGLTDVVPLLLETELVERGGLYASKGLFEEFAVRDGNLITGQNPASSAATANLLLEALA